MASITLLYQIPFASATNGTFEISKGNWADGGTYTSARTTTAAQVRTGIGALAGASGGTGGNYATNNISLATAYMPALVLGHTYKIRLHAKAAAASPGLTIANAGNTTGTMTAISTGGFYKCELDFTAQAADVATPLIKIWWSTADSVYIDDIQVLEYSTFANALAVKGSDYPDGIEIYPDILTKLLDGSYHRVQPKVFNRLIHFELGVISLKIQQVFLANFAFQAMYNSYILGSEEVEVIIPDLGKFANTWLDDCELSRYYAFDVIEKTGRSTNPSSWS